MRRSRRKSHLGDSHNADGTRAVCFLQGPPDADIKLFISKSLRISGLSRFSAESGLAFFLHLRFMFTARADCDRQSQNGPARMSLCGRPATSYEFTDYNNRRSGKGLAHLEANKKYFHQPEPLEREECRTGHDFGAVKNSDRVRAGAGKPGDAGAIVGTHLPARGGVYI